MTSHVEFGTGRPPGGSNDELGGSGWKLLRLEDGLVELEFSGHLDTEGGAASATVVSEALRTQPRRLVLRVHAMQGYDRGARLAWQEVLWPQRTSIRALVLIGGNAVVRMGASVMAMFLGVPLERPDAPRNSGHANVTRLR